MFAITAATESGIRELVASRKLVQQLNPPGAPGGLYVFPNWVTPEEEQEIVNFVCQGQWSDEISAKRLTQHFGYRYSVNGYWKSEEKLASDWGVLRKFADRIEAEYPGIQIAQCLANVYQKDTGIAAHRDKETPLVFGISLVGDCNMIWSHLNDEKVKYEALIPARSLYIMCDDAAFNWKHAVPAGRKRVYYPDATGALTISREKPDNYIRLSITFRHFAETRPHSQPSLPPTPVEERLEACHLQGVIPEHQLRIKALVEEHPWQQIMSRFGKPLSRLVCPGSMVVSPTSALYGKWVRAFCERVLCVPVEIVAAFANLYPDGSAALPAHRDEYDRWVFGLSFGAPRKFEFVADADGRKASIEMHSGDVLLFSPGINRNHKHQIPAQKKELGLRVNITYFLKPAPGMPADEAHRRFLNPPDLTQVTIPTLADAAGY